MLWEEQDPVLLYVYQRFFSDKINNGPINLLCNVQRQGNIGCIRGHISACIWRLRSQRLCEQSMHPSPDPLLCSGIWCEMCPWSRTFFTSLFSTYHWRVSFRNQASGLIKNILLKLFNPRMSVKCFWHNCIFLCPFPTTSPLLCLMKFGFSSVHSLTSWKWQRSFPIT